MTFYVLAAVHLICYIGGIFVVSLVTKQIDYLKFLKVRSNKDVYLCYIIVTLLSGYLLGEFVYSLITLFIR